MNIVFDFGAVLVNWRPHDVVRKHFPKIAHSQETAAQLATSLFAHADWHAFDAGRVSAQEISQQTADRVHLDVSAVQHMVGDIEDHIQPIASSVQLLESLHAQRAAHGHKIYFLSNMPVPYARGLERHAFMRCFDGGIWSGDVGLIKPQPEIFELLESNFGLKNQPILFIDDHADNIAAAQQVGWQTIHLTDPQQLTTQLHSALSL